MSTYTTETITEELRGLLAKGLNIDVALIKEGSKLADWGGDSLQFIETIFDIEQHFGISFPDDANQRVSDFDSLVDIIRQELAKKG